MKPATELIHHSDGVSRDAEPLTTPIYETTTFLFRERRGGARVQRGEVVEVPVFALRESDGRRRSSRRLPRSKGPKPRSCFRAGRRRRRRRCWR